MLSRLAEIIDKDRSTERFKVGIERDKAEMDTLRTQIDLCKVAVGSSEAEAKKTATRCVADLTGREAFGNLRLDLVRSQIELCKLAATSTDAELKKVAVKCLADLTERGVLDGGSGKRRTTVSGGS